MHRPLAFEDSRDRLQALSLEPLESGVVGRRVVAAGDRVEFTEIDGQNNHGNLLSVGAGEVTNYAAA